MSNLNEFFYMGGYAFYVWLSYGATAVVLLGNLVWPMVQKRQILQSIRYAQKRQDKLARRQVP